MLNQFLHYIDRQGLIKPNQKVLLAVSGGVDSMVMTHLFLRSHLSFAMVHCNFQLRGEDSVLDQNLVQNYAKEIGVELYSCVFETINYAKSKGISTQMAARELRFEYFNRIVNEFHYDLLATAHHEDDQAETFFVNLARGTGIKGMRGILPKSQAPYFTHPTLLIHPLLFATKEQIKEYAIQFQLPYRDDISNASDKYIRNKIRLQILPSLKTLNPNFQSHLLHSMQVISHTNEVLESLFLEVEKEVVSYIEEEIHLNIPKLVNQRKGLPILFLENLLLPFGYSTLHIQSLWKLSSDGVLSGKIFESSSHQILLNRQEIVIKKKGSGKVNTTYFLQPPFESLCPIVLKFESLKIDAIVLEKGAFTAYLDEELLHYPLQLRKWKTGDYFYPYGGKGRKKLSDFFTNAKLSLFEKEKIWLLCSGQDIVWVVGYRIDHRYRLTSKTKNVLKINFILS